MPDSTIRRGCRVEHPIYGQGIVLAVFPDVGAASVTWDVHDTYTSPLLADLTVVPSEDVAEIARLYEAEQEWLRRADEMEQRAERAEARIGAALAVTERIGYRPAQAALRAALTDEQPAANHPESPDSSPEPEWEYGVRDYRTPVIVIGPDPMREYRLAAYGTRPLVRRRPASDWEDYDDAVTAGSEEQR